MLFLLIILFFNTLNILLKVLRLDNHLNQKEHISRGRFYHHKKGGDY